MLKFYQCDSKFYEILRPGNMLVWCMERNGDIRVALFMKVISVTLPRSAGFFRSASRGNVRVQLANQQQVDLFADYQKTIDEISWEIESYIEHVPGLACRMNKKYRFLCSGSDNYCYKFPFYICDENDAFELKNLMEIEMGTREHQAALDQKFAKDQAEASLRHAQSMKEKNAQAAGQIDDLFRRMNKK